MRTDMERRVVGLLHGGHALGREESAALINELGAEGLDILRGVAEGQIPVEHPQLRLNAISALGLDATEPEASARVLLALLDESPPRVAIHAIRALGQLPVEREQLRGLIRDPDTPPAVALAAARVAVRDGGEEVVAELRDLRRRLRDYVESDNSPSLLSIDRLISEARHGRRGPDGPRPVA